MRTLYPQTGQDFDVEQVIKLYFSHVNNYKDQEYIGPSELEIVAPEMRKDAWEDERPNIYVTNPWGIDYELVPENRKGRCLYVLRYEY